MCVYLNSVFCPVIVHKVYYKYVKLSVICVYFIWKHLNRWAAQCSVHFIKPSSAWANCTQIIFISAWIISLVLLYLLFCVANVLACALISDFDVYNFMVSFFQSALVEIMLNHHIIHRLSVYQIYASILFHNELISLTHIYGRSGWKSFSNQVVNT